MTPAQAIRHLTNAGHKVTEPEPGLWTVEGLAERVAASELVRLARKHGSEFREYRVGND